MKITDQINHYSIYKYQGQDLKTHSSSHKQCSTNESLLKKYPYSQDIIQLLESKNIPITESNLLAVNSAKQGTTIEEADYLTKIIKNRKDSPVYDLVVELLSESLSNQVISSLQENKKVTRTHSVHQSTNVIHHKFKGNTYEKNVHSSYESVSCEEYGYFTHPLLQESLDKATEGKVDHKIKDEIRDNIRTHFDTLVDDMSSYDFEVLVREAVLSNDGTLTDEELYSLSKLPYEYEEAMKSYESTISKIKDYSKNISNIHVAEGISTIIHDSLLNDDYSDYLSNEDITTLRKLKALTENIIQDFSDENIDSLQTACDKIETKPISRSRLINTAFKSPNGVISNRPNDYTLKAKYMLRLLHVSNIGIEFDGVMRNHKTISTDLSSPGYAKKNIELKQTTEKKYEGKQILNKVYDNQIFMNMIGNKNIQVLDINFIQLNKVLSFSNFILKLNLHYLNYGQGNIDIHVSDYKMNFRISSDSNALITHVKSREEFITSQTESMGFKDIKYTYHHTNTITKMETEDGFHHSIRTENQFSTQTKVSI